ncbi:MAG: hypothetical protein L0H93_08870 [Nocardioides sp.]|nr:hypothetical protein [Nocardioides sp.]
MNLKKSLMILPVVLMGLSFFGGCGSDDESDKSSDDKSSVAQDQDSPEAAGGEEGASTKVTKCAREKGTGLMFSAHIEVTNESSEVHSYVLNLEVKDAAGKTVAEPNGTTGDIAPGESATSEAPTQVTDELKGKGLTCEVTDVTVN